MTAPIQQPSRAHFRRRLILLGYLSGSLFSLHAEMLSPTNLLAFERGGEVHTVRTPDEWMLRRADILRRMQSVMGPLPARANRAALDMRVEEEVDCGRYVRRLITYVSEADSRVPAYLLVPKAALDGTAQFPAVLALHPTHSLGHKVVVGLVRGTTNREYAQELAERGYVCLAPAYPLLANYHPDLKKLGYESGTMKAIWDNIRGLDLLESLPFVKSESFGAIGHSLGGHNSIYTAVFDERIEVVVSSCGFDSYRDYKDGDITGWTSERYMPKLKQYAPDRYPFDFHEIIGALAPRMVFVSAPIGDSNFKWHSVDAVAAAARPVFSLHGKPENLRIEHPDCDHQFPKEMREIAYQTFDRHLK